MLYIFRPIIHFLFQFFVSYFDQVYSNMLVLLEKDQSHVRFKHFHFLTLKKLTDNPLTVFAKLLLPCTIIG